MLAHLGAEGEPGTRSSGVECGVRCAFSPLCAWDQVQLVGSVAHWDERPPPPEGLREHRAHDTCRVALQSKVREGEEGIVSSTQPRPETGWGRDPHPQD